MVDDEGSQESRTRITSIANHEMEISSVYLIDKKVLLLVSVISLKKNFDVLVV